MYSELPKLFDRNFVIAYFLPVSLFLTTSAWFIKSTGYWPTVRGWLTGDTLFDVTLAILLAWMAAVLLLVLNREIFRFLEGYGKYNPLRIQKSKVVKEFKDKAARRDWLKTEYANGRLENDLEVELIQLMTELAERYPDEEAWLLPTVFGNAVRAFEVYPRVMYGIEGIDGWPRILTAIPKEYRDLIDDAKVQVDWWINLGMMSLVFLIEFWVVVFSKWGYILPWNYILLNILIPLVVFTLLNRFFSWRAVSSAIGWGDYVKSAFDTYRFSLLRSYSVDIPKSRDAEKELWHDISLAVLCRMPEKLPPLKENPGKLATENPLRERVAE